MHFAKHTKYASLSIHLLDAACRILFTALAEGFADHLVKRLEDGLKIVFRVSVIASLCAVGRQDFEASFDWSHNAAGVGRELGAAFFDNLGVPHHIGNMLGDVEGKFPEDKQNILDAVDRFLNLNEEQRVY